MFRACCVKDLQQLRRNGMNAAMQGKNSPSVYNTCVCNEPYQQGSLGL